MLLPLQGVHVEHVHAVLHGVVGGPVAGEGPAAPHHARHPSLGGELREKLGVEIHSTGSLQKSSQNFLSLKKQIVREAF